MAGLTRMSNKMIEGKIAVGVTQANNIVTISFNDGSSISFTATAILGSSSSPVMGISTDGANLIIEKGDGSTQHISLSSLGGGSGGIGPTGPTGPQGPQGPAGSGGGSSNMSLLGIGSLIVVQDSSNMKTYGTPGNTLPTIYKSTYSNWEGLMLTQSYYSTSKIFWLWGSGTPIPGTWISLGAFYGANNANGAESVYILCQRIA